MSDRIVLCATAAQAAEFCRAEKSLVEADAESSKKSVFTRLGRKPNEGSHRALEGADDRRYGGQSRHGDNQSKSRKGQQALPSDFAFFYGYGLFGDSMLTRMAKAGGSYVSRNNNFCYGGATSDVLVDRINKCVGDFPRRAIFLAGTNDLLNGASKFQVANNIRLATNLLQSKGVDVKVLTIPPFRIDMPEHAGLEFINRKIRALDCTVVDIYGLFKGKGVHMNDLYERRYFNGKKDLIHPNNAGLKLMMSEVLRHHSSSHHNEKEHSSGQKLKQD